jgi:hypothetical protein
MAPRLIRTLTLAQGEKIPEGATEQDIALYRVLEQHKLPYQGSTHYLLVYDDGTFRVVTKLPERHP